MMMLAMEEVLCELSDHEKKNEQGLPPGFRFHPTDEELITFYLASKVYNGCFSSTNNVKFAEVDLNRCEPWELPDVAKMGEREWYLFSLRDRKYPTGLRTNRATGAGYWKATGKDKEVYSGATLLIGMKKTLVFYKGRAPRGEKTKWVMHEYRLDGHFSPHSHRSHTCKEEWVICRIFHKSGEKRTQLLQVQQGQHHLGASSSPKKPCLPPPLQATPTSFTALELHESQSQVSSQRDFQNDKNDLSFSHLFPLHAFQQYSFPVAAAAATNNTQGGDIITHARGRNHPSSELLFNFNKSSHLSQHNNCPTLKQTIPKTEATTTFYEIHQSLDHDDGSNNNLRWMDNSSNDFHNTFRPLETLDSGLMPFSGAATTNAEFRDMMSASIPFNRVALEYAPVGIDSWPQPQLV